MFHWQSNEEISESECSLNRCLKLRNQTTKEVFLTSSSGVQSLFLKTQFNLQKTSCSRNLTTEVIPQFRVKNTIPSSIPKLIRIPTSIYQTFIKSLTTSTSFKAAISFHKRVIAKIHQNYTLQTISAVIKTRNFVFITVFEFPLIERYTKLPFPVSTIKLSSNDLLTYKKRIFIFFLTVI
jgi:hypothetical protein